MPGAPRLFFLWLRLRIFAALALQRSPGLNDALLPPNFWWSEKLLQRGPRLSFECSSGGRREGRCDAGGRQPSASALPPQLTSDRFSFALQLLDPPAAAARAESLVRPAQPSLQVLRASHTLPQQPPNEQSVQRLLTSLSWKRRQPLVLFTSSRYFVKWNSTAGCGLQKRCSRPARPLKSFMRVCVRGLASCSWAPD